MYIYICMYIYIYIYIYYVYIYAGECRVFAEDSLPHECPLSSTRCCGTPDLFISFFLRLIIFF